MSIFDINLSYVVQSTKETGNIYYHDEKSVNILLTKNNNWEITMSKNNNQKAIINWQPLFNFRNNGPQKTGRLSNLPNGLITSIPLEYIDGSWSVPC